MTKIPMPESLREEIVKLALREVCAVLVVDDQLDASRLKESAVAIAEAGAAAYAATISKDAEIDKQPSEESRVIEMTKADALCELIQSLWSVASIDNINVDELTEQLSKAYGLNKSDRDDKINSSTEFFELVEEDFIQIQQRLNEVSAALKSAKAFCEKWSKSKAFPEDSVYAKKSVNDLTMALISSFLNR